MKVFLTGGAGFIGSHIAEALVSEGHEVVIYDNFSSGRRENLAWAGDKVEVIEGDVLDRDRLFSACPRDVDVISHQAAQLEIFHCLEDPADDLRTNTLGTINVLELARARGVRRFVNASSACVYGQAQYVPQGEDHPTVPHWPYGASKLAAEHYVRIYAETYGLETVSLRYGIVYGPREWYGRVLTMFLARRLQGKPPVVFGGGEAVRDFIHVQDVVRVHNSCLVCKDLKHRVLNVGTGRGTSIKELAQMVCKLEGEPSMQPIFEDVPEGAFSKEMPTRKRIPQELRAMVLAPDAMKHWLGITPAWRLEDGLRDEWEWLKKHPTRWNIEQLVRV